MKKVRPRTGEVQRLVHELAVQQLELERQNEQIRSAQHELEAFRHEPGAGRRRERVVPEVRALEEAA